MGTRQSVKVICAVSEARMPSLCSSRSTETPGWSRGTTKDLMAARPLLLSRVAHTTMWSARAPEVTKILVPLRTYSSPSRRAVADTAAESEPKSGSVMAMEAHTRPNFSICSSLATAAMAEFPRPCRGIESVRPTSPQQVSMMLSSDFMLPPLETPSRLGAPPDPIVAPEAAWPASSMASIMALRVSSSTGYSCSARSYLREMGRKIWVATWRA